LEDLLPGSQAREKNIKHPIELQQPLGLQPRVAAKAEGRPLDGASAAGAAVCTYVVCRFEIVILGLGVAVVSSCVHREPRCGAPLTLRRPREHHVEHVGRREGSHRWPPRVSLLNVQRQQAIRCIHFEPEAEQLGDLAVARPPSEMVNDFH
jgi:hypothetical protein